MEPIKAKIEDDGSLVIPASLMKSLNWADGDSVVVELQGGGLRIQSLETSVAEVQDWVKQTLGDGSLADELIAERRAEAEKG